MSSMSRCTSWPAVAPRRSASNSIAKEADVTWGTVQYQFGDADGFWAATILHILDTAGPRVWGRPSAGSVETRVAEVIDLLWKAFDSPYNAVVTNLRTALAKDRIELERSYPRTAAGTRCAGRQLAHAVS